MKTIKKAVAVLGAAVATVVPMVAAPAAMASSYGPTRTDYTTATRPTSTVFNSVMDNNASGANNAKAIGDERYFVRIIGANGDLEKDATLEPGKRYNVYIFFRNDSSSASSIATGSKMSISIPIALEKGKTGELKATITSDNANPKSVWATAGLTASDNMKLYYKLDSNNTDAPDAMLWNQFNNTSGIAMPASLFTSAGALLGMSSPLEGSVRGGDNNAGSVTFTLMTEAWDGSSTPTSTPNTGPAEVFIGIACVLAVGGGAGALIMSRRSTARALRQAKGRK